MIACLFGFIGLLTLEAQSEKQISIEYAGKLNVDEKQYPGARILTRDDSQQVQISHNGTLMWCDKALYYGHENFIEAYGNVLLKQGDTISMRSKYIEYSGQTELAFASGHVVLKDPQSTITSETLYFDRLKQQSFYQNQGRVVKDSSGTITSKIGRYYMKTKKYQFVENVVLVNDETTIYSNYFDFYSDTGYAYLFGPSTIVSEDSKTYCEKGFYDTNNKVGHAVKKAKIYYDNRIIESDSLFFDNKTNFASATNNIIITDTINKSIIKGHYAEVFKEKDSVFITKRALAITIQENDSIYIHADKIMVTGKPENRIIKAYYNAKIFKSEISGKADSIHSEQKSGITKLINIPRLSAIDKFSVKRRPILWNFENQITGDTIHLISNNDSEKIDSLLVFNNAFTISKDTISKTGFNQIYGLRLVGLFNDENQLRQVDIKKNAESIFYVRNDKQELIGIDKAKSGNIAILFDNGEIEAYTRENQVDGHLYPESEYQDKDRLLKGFDWREEERPLSVEDLFNEDTPFTLAKISGLKDYIPQEAFFDSDLLFRIERAGKGQGKLLAKPVFKTLTPDRQPKNQFQLILTAEIEENDTFQLAYTNGSKSFSQNEPIKKQIRGKNEFQSIEFQVPFEGLPDDLRLEIGTNSKQKPIKINSVILRYKTQEIYIPSHLIPNYFIANNFIDYNANTSQYATHGNKNNTSLYLPYFTTSKDLLELILKLNTNGN